MIERLAADKGNSETMTGRRRDYGDRETESFIGFKDERD